MKHKAKLIVDSYQNNFVVVVKGYVAEEKSEKVCHEFQIGQWRDTERIKLVHSVCRLFARFVIMSKM